MPRVHLTTPDGATHAIDAAAGSSLMRAVLDAGLPGLAADCGGCLSCATCHVQVDPEWLGRLPPRSNDESAMLDMTAAPRTNESRLACQIMLDASHDGLCVRCADRQY